ncbi:L,D-transpeptidase family protein [Aquibium sp. A9E412]|uniref:L,D-transpeptidase family protein n=1 Tax=Aquibium sp. A9E412 TaxID=2976767 RepID=UPI0025AFFBE6|nr:L,D-transpeptidase family protein [Aquibium sp. A9E412]MDN2565731.1 L,D-transpeptidase family protein [Aquibium sp. A9E412]
MRPRPGHPREGLIAFAGTVRRCALGRGATTVLKREGDGATPLAAMPLTGGYFRPRRAGRRPAARLDLAPIGADLGWCDAPSDRNYNRPVRLPYPASAERMRRDDHLYDVCLVLDWNLRPRRRGRGSAIFLHLARPGFAPTEGCVAVDRPTMARLLGLVRRGTRLVVTR